jgi:hypothetical protein
MFGLVVVGSLTAIYAWLCGLVQTDVKSALIFATVFQVALMFVAIGLGWTTLATVHLCLHAAWRAWQFLLAPFLAGLTRQRPAPAAGLAAPQPMVVHRAMQRFWLDKLAADAARQADRCLFPGPAGSRRELHRPRCSASRGKASRCTPAGRWSSPTACQGWPWPLVRDAAATRKSPVAARSGRRGRDNCCSAPALPADCRKSARTAALPDDGGDGDVSW